MNTELNIRVCPIIWMKNVNNFQIAEVQPQGAV